MNLANFQQFAAINVLSDPGYDPDPHVVPNCIQISLVWALGGGKQAHNVMAGSRTDGLAPTQAHANAILTGLATGGAWTALAAFLAPTVTFGAVFLRDLRAFNMPVIPSNTTGAAGTSTGTELPNEVALAATFRTAFVGAGNRGRLYLPGWSTTALAAGNVASAAAIAAYQTWLNTIPTVFSQSGYTFALRQPSRIAYTGSSGRNHAARAAGTVPITSQTIRDNHWDSQRRRGLK